MEQFNITVRPGQQLETVHCPVCGSTADGFEHRPGYAVTKRSDWPWQADATEYGQLDELDYDMDAEIRHDGRCDLLVLQPCGHQLPRWGNDVVFQGIFTAIAVAHVNALTERQQQNAKLIHAALVAAAIDRTDLRQVAQVAAQAVTR